MDVSWLIPVRNGREWLLESVESALAECGQGDEVVVVDDGSTDDSHKVLPQDARIRLYRRPAQGIVEALEFGRARCRNPYIARLDADDVALAGRVDAQRQFLDANPTVAVVGGRAHMVCERGELSAGMQRYVDWVNGLRNLHAELLVESPLFHPAVMMRGEAIGEVGGYRDDGLPEDYDLWLRLVRAGHRLEALAHTVVQIRDHPRRLTRTHPRYHKRAFDRAKMNWLESGPLTEPCRTVVWGAGRSGRPWIRWLLAQGHTVVAVIDPFQGTKRQGVPVLNPSALASMEFDALLVAVGSAAARESIRATIQHYRPDFIEGEDWWAVC